MQYRRLGKSDLNVSVIAFGAWQIGDEGYWGAEGAGDAAAVVQSAIDGGINLFDTAEMYGNGESERVLGRALGSRRDKVLIASKVSPQHCTPEGLRASCDASLRRLGTDRIDLYQIHWPFRDASFDVVYEEMMKLKKAGKIREVGVSNFGAADLDAWMAVGACVSNQLGYNLAFRAIEYEVVPACMRHGVGILVYMPLLQGILTCRWGRAEDVPEARRRTRHFSGSRSGVRHGEGGCEELLFEMLRQLSDMARDAGTSPAAVALGWLLSREGVSSVIVGARNPAQLERNLNAADAYLSETLLREADRISEPLKEKLGTNSDMWLGALQSRIR